MQPEPDPANIVQHASIILPGSRISGTQPLQPRPSFWKSMHLNVLVWHEIGACLSVCASTNKTERFTRTSNGAYSRMYNQFFFPLHSGRARWLPRQPACVPMVCRHCYSNTHEQEGTGGGGNKCVCEKVCKLGSTLGNNLQYVSWWESAGPTIKQRLTNNQWGKSQLFCTNPKSLLMSLTWLHLI